MIEIKNMSFGYKRQKLFNDLSLSLSPGNIYGLLGKNGAGKTTLLKIICGLRLPQEGSCSVLGMDPAKRPVHLLEDICFISEELHVAAIPPALFLRLYAPLYPRFSHTDFADYAKEFELELGKSLNEMSYGQKKKFLLAFGLATRCRVLLLDEPTNGLDIPSKSQFRRLLARAGGTDQVILISTHQVRDMENLIDPIIILDQGKIIFQQAIADAAARLTTQLEREEPTGDGVLYSEKTLGGWVVVRANENGQESSIDLETLFNAVTTSGEKIATLFETAASREA
ncbi:MAG TPA: ABC transporter ATP-binding protein [Spirochaetia bacterium]